MSDFHAFWPAGQRLSHAGWGQMTVWDQVLARVETKVNRHSFSTWFRRTEFVTDDGQRVTIRVPDTVFRDWLLKHYSGVLADALAEVGRSDTALTFVTEAEANTQQAAVERDFAPPADATPSTAEVEFPVVDSRRRTRRPARA